ncbi:MAG: LPS-assembly protein LptD [Planctomycetes bacterium ADurb.Bin126]|nr:MAG: LPS-assembly protein LptD [Planctomycetes bacterium ADurb.Bin126]HOD82317.1 LPS assembly protein LptD [Phycisphaerae bacterium]HQL72780.1 LPS assembly protein LptD [Phycisphaerae bacterium]
MSERSGNAMRRCAAVLLLALAAAAQAAPVEYIHEDVRVTGQEIHGFTDDQRNVSVVLGSFKLVVGGRTITGRDAVLWIRSQDIGGAERHDIVVYVEGDARVSEPGGTVSGDKTMLVHLHVQGRIRSARPVLGQRPLTDLPLYQRARVARDVPVVPPSTQPAHDMAIPWHPSPVLVVKRPGEKPPAPATKPGTGEGPAVAAGPGESPASRPGAKPVPPPPTPQPVSFYADHFTSHREGDIRIWVAKGNVYLSQGDPDGKLFLEMRSQSAVVFTIPQDAKDRPAPKDTRSPFSPRAGRSGSERGADVPSAGAGAGVPIAGASAASGESLLGVYLEDDVILSRGERFMRGQAAYYDFTVDRAMVVEPVFRTIQEQRNIPIYIRAREARVLSARQTYFHHAKISTSDFYSPSYHVGARKVYITDTTPYDEKGVALDEPSMQAKLYDSTLAIHDVPIFYWPYTNTEVQDLTSPLKRLTIGRDGEFGPGVDSEWHLFRLLGLVKPAGYTGTLGLSVYQRRTAASARLRYVRDDYSGYAQIGGVIDREQEDDFGDLRRNLQAPEERGRVLLRHKQFLQDDWQLQFELSYICDRNYLEQYNSAEFHAGKEQETLLYAKKQRDNWAFDALLKYRINRFQNQTESLPDLGFYLVGQPLLDDTFTYFNESHAGLLRYRPPNFSKLDDNGCLVRTDTRNELDLPLRFGPVQVVPFATGRATWWSRSPADDQFTPAGVQLPYDGDDSICRPYGNLGVRSATSFWRIYDNVDNRLLDVHRLKHVITPEVTAFASDAHNITRGDLDPFSLARRRGLLVDPDNEGFMDGGIERHLDGMDGVEVGLTQRLQTKRGANRDQTVDWMRLRLSLGFYNNYSGHQLSDGRFYLYRPEYSIGRNHLNADYDWQISNSTRLSAYGNYDLERDILGRWGTQLAVSRTPRLQYMVGLRSIKDMDSTAVTAGFTYQIDRRYALSVFELYDLDFHGRQNEMTTVTLTRKFSRWYVALTWQWDQVEQDCAVLVTIWPEGMPEFRLGEGHNNFLSTSGQN